MQFNIVRPDRAIEPALRDKIENLTKPKGSLGRLEELALQVGLIQQTLEPSLRHPVNVIYAADHGIADENISKSPKEVTRQVIYNFLNGGAGICFLARQHGFDIKIVDGGVDYDFPPIPELIDRKIRKGTRNYLHEAAMTEEELELAPGALYLIPALTPLKFISVSPCTHYWCHFLSERLRYIPAPGRMYRVRCRSRRRYEAAFQALFSLLSGRDTMAAAVEIRHRMDTLLLPFLEAAPLFGEHPLPEDGRILQVLDYIEAHLKEPIRIGTLCRRINMSESDFLKKFRHQQGAVQGFFYEFTFPI